MARRLVALTGFAGGAFAALVAYRRGLSARRERIEVHFADGSLVSFAPSSAEARRLLPYARDIAAAARDRP